MQYSPEYLIQFRVKKEPYTYAKLNAGLVKIPLIKQNSKKAYFALVQVEESPIREFQCVTGNCDFKSLYSCVGARCLPGGRKDNKAVVFKIEFIYQID